MTLLVHSVSIGWLDLDGWSTTYVGAHWLATSELPAKQYQTSPRHGPLSQLLLISAHHLVEVMFFKCVNKLVDASPGVFTGIEKQLQNDKSIRFGAVIKEWPRLLTGCSFDLSQEPFKSIERLNTRRNATIHKESALASLDMARSALFSAVQASRAMSEHLLGVGSFKRYETVLQKYPLPDEPWFSDVKFIERFRSKKP
ncbi:MAG: hypothetical protein KDJ28_01595 [Candidatus Competibacteraceae bacterium]|nr:hypothetical protein [Candidatus Competibacteraceae bacterium]